MSAIEEWEVRWERNKVIVAELIAQPVEVSLAYYDVRKAFEDGADALRHNAYELDLDEPLQGVRLILLSIAYVPNDYRGDEYVYTFKAEANI